MRFYKSCSSSISSFSLVATYLISFSFGDVTCTPTPQFLYGFSLFQRIFFLRLGGAVAPPRPPLATPLKSASQHPDVIDKYLSAEVAHRRVAGPYPYPPLPSPQTSPFGVIPKRHQLGKWRLILDLSSPQGASVNDGIPKDPFSTSSSVVLQTTKSLIFASYDRSEFVNWIYEINYIKNELSCCTCYQNRGPQGQLGKC